MPGFEPFLDYKKLTPEMAQEMHRAVGRFYHARDAFLRFPPSIKGCVAVIEATYEMDRTIDTIRQTLWTLPVMVHVAGERSTEQCGDCGDHELVVQRCKRCGSKLNQWEEHQLAFTPSGPREIEEDEIPWWDEGEIVAKGHSAGAISMYLIEPDRELEKHEMECVALVGLGDES